LLPTPPKPKTKKIGKTKFLKSHFSKVTVISQTSTTGITSETTSTTGNNRISVVLHHQHHLSSSSTPSYDFDFFEDLFILTTMSRYDPNPFEEEETHVNPFAVTSFFTFTFPHNSFSIIAFRFIVLLPFNFEMLIIFQ
jgi:hypothetical protein